MCVRMSVGMYVCISYAQQPSVHPFVTNEKSALNFATGTKRVHTLRLYLSACALHTQTHTHTLGSRLNSAHSHTHTRTYIPRACTYTYIARHRRRRSAAHHVPMYSRAIVSSFRCFVISSSFRCLLDSLRFAFRLRRCRRCCCRCRQHRFRDYVCV